MEAVILAGGLGLRLRAVVQDLPKPMAPIRGRPFLEYQLEYWISQGVTRFILSIGYKGKVIQNHFNSEFMGIPIDYVEEEHPLGTGGGALLASTKLLRNQDFLILNGDTFLKIRLDQLRTFHKETGADVTLSLTQLPINTRYGAVRLGLQGQILSFLDKGSPECSDLPINAGAYIFKSDIFEKLEYRVGTSFSIESSLFPKVIQKKLGIFGCKFSEMFIDIGVPEDYFRAERS